MARCRTEFIYGSLIDRGEPEEASNCLRDIKREFETHGLRLPFIQSKRREKCQRLYCHIFRFEPFFRYPSLWLKFSAWHCRCEGVFAMHPALVGARFATRQQPMGTRNDDVDDFPHKFDWIRCERGQVSSSYYKSGWIQLIEVGKLGKHDKFTQDKRPERHFNIEWKF